MNEKLVIEKGREWLLKANIEEICAKCGAANENEFKIILEIKKVQMLEKIAFDLGDKLSKIEIELKCLSRNCGRE